MSELPVKGLTRDDIMNQLAEMKKGDLPWKSGRVWAYVYDPGEAMEIAKEAYMMYLSESALDPTTFPSVHRLETEVVRMIADLLQGDENVVGNFTSGGTESNLCAVKAARDYHLAHRPNISKPELIMPMTAHPSFHKACVYFGIKPRVVGFDKETFKANVDEMRDAINENTIMLVASAPGYAQGVVDPIEEIGALAQEHNLHFHVDGCVGGIHLSFMRKSGKYNVATFDFTVPGVTSISADMHKYGYAPKNASVILHRNKDLRYYQIFSCISTTTYALINPTVMSTKSGGPMAASWATLQYLGETGYIEIIDEVMDCTKKLVDGINAVDGVRVLGTPEICMFSVAAEDFNIFQLCDEMRDRGWYIQPQFSTPLSPPNIHITVNRGSVHLTDEFLADFKDAVDALRSGKVETIDTEMVGAQVKEMLASSNGNLQEQLNAMAGLSDGELPEKMSLINTVMDALPDDVSEHLLSSFINDIYV